MAAGATLTRRRPCLGNLFAPRKGLLFRANHSVDLAMEFPEGAITFGGCLRGLALHALGRLLEIGMRIQSSGLRIFGDALCPDRLTGSSLDRLGKAKSHGKTGNDRGSQDCLISCPTSLPFN